MVDEDAWNEFTTEPFIELYISDKHGRVAFNAILKERY